MKICILGAGVYGIALAKVLNNENNEINMWTALEDEAINLSRDRMSPALKNVTIDQSIEISNDLEGSIKDKDALLVAIPTKYLNTVFSNLKPLITKNQYLIIASKGLDDSKDDFLSNTLKKFDIEKKLGFISGPTFAIDLAQGDYGTLTAASEDDRTLSVIEEMFKDTNVSISKSNDIYGVQILNTVKNVMAIIMGMSSELHLSETTRTKLLLIMLDEVKKMLSDFGGQEKTLMERAGIGDIILTCLNEKSRNYYFGKLLASNYEEAMRYKDNTTVEGLSNLSHLKNMIDERNKSYIFIDLIYDIIYNEKNIDGLKTYIMTK